jgi:hypothetical protein
MALSPPLRDPRRIPWTLTFVPLCLATYALAACGGPEDTLHEPMPLEEHEVRIEANASGDAKNPAHVAIFLRRGSLRLTTGADVTVLGIAKGGLGDAPPRVERGEDRIAVVQSNVGGAPPRGDANFVLSLGKTPLALEVNTGSGQDQAMNLGGAALVEGRFSTESGHLTLDWSAPNALPSATLVLQTDKGYIDVTHLGRLGGGAVTVKTREGSVALELGDFAGPSLSIDADVGTGILRFKAPSNVAARAEVATPVRAVVTSGWRMAGGAFALGDPNAAPRVTLRARGGAARVELSSE